MPVEVDIDSNNAIDIAFGGTGATTIEGAKTNLGINNVDNTSDANKPISDATQVALDNKLAIVSTDETLSGDGTVENPLVVVPGAWTQLNSYKTASFNGEDVNFCEVLSMDEDIDFTWDSGNKIGSFVRPTGNLIEDCTIRINNNDTGNIDILFDPSAITDGSTRIPLVEIYDSTNNLIITSSVAIRMGFPVREFGKLTLVGLPANNIIIKLSKF